MGLSFEARNGIRLRQVLANATARISSTCVAGSGTAAVALATALAVRPKLDRHTL